MRCGSCNEVFDGNAALLEPIAKPQPAAMAPATPLPEPIPFDQKMAALDTRAAEVLGNEPIYTLELDTALEAADTAPPADDIALDIEPEPQAEPEHEPLAAPAPEYAAGPESSPAVAEAPLDLDLDIEPEPQQQPEPAAEPELAEAADLDVEPEPAVEPASQLADEPPFEDALSVEAMSEEELDAALEAELAAMEQSIVPEREPETVEEPSPDFFAEMLAAGDRREPTWDEPAPAAPGPLEPTWDEPMAVDAAAPAAAEARPARPPRADELDEVDEEALVQLSSAGLAEAQSARAHAHLHTASQVDEPAADEDTEAPADEEEADEPGFVKRGRRRQKFGKAATIAMSLGSLLLVGALAAQGLTTFRNQIAAAMPPLKPALLAACNALGCKIELPAQIDDLTIEQGELQTLSETTFSFTTLLRNQGSTAQAWPHIELVLDDAADKRILRRVFTPRDYLGADAAPDKGFAPHTEQSVKLYFELNQLKASGYHIAVFYP